MTLQEAYNSNVGQSIPSPDGDPADAGQCVSWASYVLKNVYNHPYIYANAINWWENPGLTDKFDFIPYTSGVYPKTGDFVVWGSGVGSQYGHIDLCATDGNASGFTGYDSNWEDIPKLTTIQHNYAYGILGYIRLKGQKADIMNTGDVRNLYINLLKHDADIQTQLTWVGNEFSELFYAIVNSPEYAFLQASNPSNATVLAPGNYKVN